LKNPFYVYALKDPRENPAKTFYIGKGTGTRAWEHQKEKGDSDKNALINEIHTSGQKVIHTILVENLKEPEALKIEAELIASFGVRSRGGFLVNKVRPNPDKISGKSRVNVPDGCYEKAQMGLELLKDSILELGRANPAGIRNAEAAKHLGLQSDYGGGARDYLTYSVLGLLMRDGQMARVEKPTRHIAVTR
jgi:uncharacterized protein